MKRRKHLCLVISGTKEMNSRRIVEGIMMQCKKYDYDLSVFSTATTLEYFNLQYTNGAANIYNLINFEKFDGVIVDTLSLARAHIDVLSGIFRRAAQYVPAYD